jgi:hypothetical protein
MRLAQPVNASEKPEFPFSHRVRVLLIVEEDKSFYILSKQYRIARYDSYNAF